MDQLRCDLPFAQPAASVKDLSHARWLVSEELYRNFSAQVDTIQSESILQQQHIHEEVTLFLSSMAAAEQTHIVSPTLLHSPLSGNLYDKKDSFPSMASHRKRARPDCEDDDNGADRGIYYESLLSQSLHAKLFLAHADERRQGAAFLQSMQRMQEVVWRADAEIQHVNALRCMEQREFAMSLDASERAVTGVQSKVKALEKALGIPASESKSGNNGVVPGASRSSLHPLLMSL